MRVRSPLLAQSLLLSIPPGNEMFQFPGFASVLDGCRALRGGLPHSEIRVCAGICPSTRLIAACHVLLRLREPRHPSCALFSFPCVFRPAESRLPFPLSDSVEPDRVSWSNFPGGCRAAGGLVCLDSLICSFVSRRLIRLGFQYVNDLFFRVVPGRVELPTSTLSV